MPTADVARWSFQAVTGDTIRLTQDHHTDLAVAGRLTFWVSPRWGLEGSVLYSPTDVTVESDAIGDTPSESEAHLLAAALRGVVRFGSAGGATAFHVATGPAISSRGGNGYVNFSETTDLAWVVGVGFATDLSPVIALRVDVEDYLSSTRFIVSRFAGERIETERKLQNDLVVSQGLRIRFGSP